MDFSFVYSRRLCSSRVESQCFAAARAPSHCSIAADCFLLGTDDFAWWRCLDCASDCTRLVIRLGIVSDSSYVVSGVVSLRIVACLANRVLVG